MSEVSGAQEIRVKGVMHFGWGLGFRSFRMSIGVEGVRRSAIQMGFRV